MGGDLCMDICAGLAGLIKNQKAVSRVYSKWQKCYSNRNNHSLQPWLAEKHLSTQNMSKCKVDELLHSEDWGKNTTWFQEHTLVALKGNTHTQFRLANSPSTGIF